MSGHIDPLSIPLPPPPSDETTKRKNSEENESTSSGSKKAKLESRVKHNAIVYEGSKEEEAILKKVMGFSTFYSTKGKKVPGNNVGSVHVVRKRHYRQYMNRQGGFNRPLDKVA